MTGNVARTRITEERSLVEVCQKDAKTLDFRRISMPSGLSVSRISHVGDQTPGNRGPDFGIIDRVACRSIDYEVTW
jgi:hypothetical protein